MTEGCEFPQFYINTICLPQSEQQFAEHTEDCFMAAWGEDPYNQTRVRITAISNFMLASSYIVFPRLARGR